MKIARFIVVVAALLVACKEPGTTRAKTPDTGIQTSTAVAIGVGWGYTCALTANGDPYCWGADPNGGADVVRPTLVGGVKLASLAVGQMGACGLTSDGTAYCWGYNAQGQLGNGTTAPATSPVEVSGGLKFTSLAAGDFNTCGIVAGGAAYCWGDNGYGQLGDSSRTASRVPVVVKGGHAFTSLSLGYRAACGVTTDNEVWCWGMGQTTEDDGIPRLHPGASGFSSITLAYATACGLQSGGIVACWGVNGLGGLGVGPDVNWRTEPGPVAGGHTFATVAGQWYHHCAVDASGHAYCWGRGEHGELGTGASGTIAYTPAPVAGGLTFATVVASTDVTCGLTTGGSMYCWGWNNHGQLGDGTTTDRYTPTSVAAF